MLSGEWLLFYASGRNRGMGIGPEVIAEDPPPLEVASGGGV